MYEGAGDEDEEFHEKQRDVIMRHVIVLFTPVNRFLLHPLLSTGTLVSLCRGPRDSGDGACSVDAFMFLCSLLS